MRGHLSEEALMDVLDGAGGRSERAHVDVCADCRTRLLAAREALALAAVADVPEPSPLYWEALRRSVGQKIAEEPGRRWRIGWLVPLAAASALLVAVWAVRAPLPAPATSATLPAWSALPPETEDPALAVLGELAVVDGDLAVWDDGRGLAAFVADLSDEETRALVEALRDESGEAEL